MCCYQGLVPYSHVMLKCVVIKVLYLIVILCLNVFNQGAVPFSNVMLKCVVIKVLYLIVILCLNVLLSRYCTLKSCYA